MSQLHSESHDEELGLRVRVKLVNLNGIGSRADENSPKSRFGSAIGIIGERSGTGTTTEVAPVEDRVQPNFEICAASGRKMSGSGFETHIETCKVCSNRVELQLDFMETLELAVYQRRGEPATGKVRGAMLISVPALNFAVCGEIEPV